MRQSLVSGRVFANAISAARRTFRAAAVPPIEAAILDADVHLGITHSDLSAVRWAFARLTPRLTCVARRALWAAITAGSAPAASRFR